MLSLKLIILIVFKDIVWTTRIDDKTTLTHIIPTLNTKIKYILLSKFFTFICFYHRRHFIVYYFHYYHLFFIIINKIINNIRCLFLYFVPNN